MDQSVEEMIEIGRKHMYKNDFEAAENIFTLVSQLDKYKISHMEVLIGMCHDRQAERITRDARFETKHPAHYTQQCEGCHEYVEEKEGEGRSKKGRDEINQCWNENQTPDPQNFDTKHDIRQYDENKTIHERKNILSSGEQHMDKKQDEEDLNKKNERHYDEVNNLEKNRLSWNPEKNNKDDEKNEQSAQFYTVCEESRQQVKIGVEKVREGEQIEHNYQGQNNDYIAIDKDRHTSLKEQVEKEAEMLSMSLILRAYVVQIGIDGFSSKPNYRPDVNFEQVSCSIDDHILRAQNCFYLGNKNDCEYHISQAEKMYSEVAIILPKASISKPKRVTNRQSENNKPENTTENSLIINSTSYKDFVKGDDIDVVKCLQLAQSALIAQNFKKAERLIKKSERICPTKNARELMKTLEAAKKEVELETAKQLAEQAAKVLKDQAICLTNKQDDIIKKDENIYIKTIKKAVDINENIEFKEVDVTRNFDLSKPVKLIIDKPAAKQCLEIAQTALDNSDFSKAERMISKAKRLDPDINIENYQSHIRMALASRSSTQEIPSLSEDSEIIFKPSDDKKRNSKECVKISDYYLKQKNLTKAEEFLLKASSYYNSNNLKDKFEHIEKLKNEQVYNIPDPCFVNSNSETCFAYDVSQEIPASYHISQNTDAGTVEEYLQNGRLALNDGLLEKAEEFARNSEYLDSGSAAGLLHNINVVKKLRQESAVGDSILRSGNAWRKPVVTSVVTPCNTVAEQEHSEGSLFSVEELAKKAKAEEYTKNAQKLLLRNIDPLLKSCENISEIENNTNPKRDNIKNIIKKAEDAYSSNDLNAAECLLKQAYDIYPDERTQSFIKIQNEKYTSTYRYTRKTHEVDNQNLEDAKSCVELAKQAHGQEDFDKAERLFTKALRMNPTEYVRDCLKKVRREKESKLIKEANIKKAEMFVSYAVTANDQEAYYVAEKYLLKALRVCYSDTTKRFLTTVQKAIKRKTNHRLKRNDKDQQEKQMKIESDKHLKIAEEQLKRGDLVNAQSSAIICDFFIPSEKSKQLLHHIFDQQCNYEKQDQNELFRNEKNIYFKSQQFMECAKNAIADGELRLARQYLMHSNKLKPTVAVKKMIYDVTTAINQEDQNSNSSSQSNHKGGFRKFCGNIINYLPFGSSK